MKALEKEFTRLFISMFSSYGLGDLPLTLLAYCYLQPREVALDELAKSTGYSLASVSTTMKALETAGFVQRTKQPGSKKVFFYMPKNLAVLNIRKLKAAQEVMLKPAKHALPGIIARFSSKAKDEESREKLRIVESYHRQLSAFERLLQKWTEDLEHLSEELE